MKDYMLFIKTKGDHLVDLSPEQQQLHVQKIGKYISNLMESSKLKSAQPLDMNGAILHGNNGVFKNGPFNETAEVIVGYFHIMAENLEEAIEIAKANPMFEDSEATIEIRPIKQMQGIN